MRKLDLGTTHRNYHCHGFTLVGIKNSDVDWDLNNFPYPWKSNSVDLIHTSHTIEHLSKENGYRMIQECYRMLKPGGKFTLCCPDMDQYIDRLLRNDWSDVEDYVVRTLDTLVGELDHEEWHMNHRYLFNKDTIELWLRKVGFSSIVFHGHHDGPYAKLFPSAYNSGFAPVSLYVSTRKPRKGVRR